MDDFKNLFDLFIEDKNKDFLITINFNLIKNKIKEKWIELNILNSLIKPGNRSIEEVEEEFKNLVEKYNEIVEVLPILLGITKNELNLYNKKENKFDKIIFKKNNIEIDKYMLLFKEIGFLKLFQKIKLKILSIMFLVYMLVYIAL
ncbi:hypothetical protein JXZ92_02350 [Mycoplasma sp. CSL10137]|uniref:DpnII family type II restriction endonuclease n=1 Tax=Mycoplasma sp. CSL10166 TaxID=2813825 RepID=UPI00197B37F2|nr:MULTISPECIES: DpnII family type II restriction endonuclease [unclassified Mycoplasma]MBN4083653.1 hypothetical protein [Mycoplasma sp. CSL10137]MBN4084062.1 hypothetical protein [Mycoplasma sp. CSL10166]